MAFIYVFPCYITLAKPSRKLLNKSSMNRFHFQIQGERVSIKYDAFYLDELSGFIRLKCAS